MRPAPLLLEVTDLDDEGRGIAEHDRRAVHIAGAWPGERVAVELEHVSPHQPRAWARLLSVERACAARTTPACPATGRCGGCPLGTISYAAQLGWKARRIEALAATLPAAPTPSPIFASPRPLGYRGHAKLVYGRAASAHLPCLGAYVPRSHELVDLAGCRVVEPVLEAVRAALLRELQRLDVAPYDEESGQGRLAYVALRASASGEVMATLVARDVGSLDALAPLVRAHDAIVSLCANERPRGNAIFGRETRVLAGRPEIDERVGEVSLYLSPTAFFQVNRDVAAAIYAELGAALEGTPGLVVDAYAGVGGIALHLARAGHDVLGIEVNAAAVRDAERAAAAQGLAARFVAADAATGLAAIDRPIAAIVVNPPRKGLDAAMLAAIAKARPARLAYVSCDPDTLFRDLAVLAAQGLSPTRLRAFDMHPQTPHIETLALCERG